MNAESPGAMLTTEPITPGLIALPTEVVAGPWCSIMDGTADAGGRRV
jgi:hypothetical protein